MMKFVVGVQSGLWFIFLVVTGVCPFFPASASIFATIFIRHQDVKQQFLPAASVRDPVSGKTNLILDRQ